MEPGEGVKHHTLDRYHEIDPPIAYKEILEKDEYVATGYFIRPFLNPIQPPSEYSRSKRKDVENLFKKKGIQTFQEYPLLLCALPLTGRYPLSEIEPNMEYRVVILDGHHRVRHLPKELANKPLFSVCFSLSQGARVYREANPRLKDKTDEEMLEEFHSYADTSLYELSKVMPRLVTPPNIQFSIGKNGLLLPKKAT